MRIAMRSIGRGLGLLTAVLVLSTATGCVDQSDIHAVKAGREFQCEQTLVTIRKEIVQWQTSPKHTDDQLPDNLTDIDTVERDIRNAPEGFWMGYYIKMYPKGDGAHYVLFAYPKEKGMSGESSYYLDDSGSAKSRNFAPEVDHSSWDYEKLVNEFTHP